MAKFPGSFSTPRLVVKPYDGSTAATVEVYGPDGLLVASPAAASIGVDPDTGGQIWEAAAYEHTAAGVWRESWDVAGTGSGVQHRRIYVSPTPGTQEPSWRPDPWKPADYVPGRTLVPVDNGGNLAVNSFDDTTRPNGQQVERLTTDACAWVQLATGPVVAESLHEAASAAAAIWVASAIEDSFPDNDASATRAAALLKRAESMLKQLQAANEAITGTDPVDPGAGLLPRWSFPAPVPWGDRYL